MAVPLREPKRKHRGSAPVNPPFPINTERATGIPVSETTWRTYTGRFNGDSVVVDKLEDISSLYSMVLETVSYNSQLSLKKGINILSKLINSVLGELIAPSTSLDQHYHEGYYGKGSLSRGCAILGRERRKQPPFLKERQWIRHELWMEMAASNAEREAASTVVNEKSKKTDDNDKNCDEAGRTSQKTPVRENSNQSNTGDKSDCPDESVQSSADENVTLIDDGDSECSDIVEVDKSGEARGSTTKRIREIDRGTEIEKDVKRMKSAPEEKNSKQTNIEVVDLSSDEDCSRQNSNEKCLKSVAKPLSAIRPTSRPTVSAIDSSNRGETEVVVLSEVDSEDEDCLSNLRPRLEYEPTYLAREKLVLSLEEAMFLSYGLGCLRVLDLRGEELSLLEIWKLFQDSHKSFVQRYVAYHYFRSKGWVVKSGLKFGGDFALYKDGPHLYHSSYIVIVEVINQATSIRNSGLSGRPMTWTQLMGLSRLSEAAGKEVLICQVVWPASVPKEKLPSPRVISSFQVHEQLLRRWIPSQDRTDHLKSRDEGNSTGTVTT